MRNYQNTLTSFELIRSYLKLPITPNIPAQNSKKQSANTYQLNLKTTCGISSGVFTSEQPINAAGIATTLKHFDNQICSGNLQSIRLTKFELELSMLLWFALQTILPFVVGADRRLTALTFLIKFLIGSNGMSTSDMTEIFFLTKTQFTNVLLLQTWVLLLIYSCFFTQQSRIFKNFCYYCANICL